MDDHPSLPRLPRADSKRRRSRRGFTLIDVLVGSALLVVAVLGLTGVAVSSNELRRSNFERVAALRALGTELATIEAASFGDLLPEHDGRAFDVVAEASGNVMLRSRPDDRDGRPGSVAVSVPDDPGDPDRLLDVTVRIDWVGSFGPQSVARTLRVSRLGVGG
jgi:hypothetical protein